MKVFCALITMIGRSGRSLLDARQQVEGVLVRHHDVGDDEVALALADPAPQRRRVAGRAHLVAGARSAWLRTVRIAASSSAIKYASRWHHASPLGFAASARRRHPCKFRHQHAEDGPSRLRLAFDDAAMIADDLGGEREAEARCRSAWWSRTDRTDAASGLRTRPGRCP